MDKTNLAVNRMVSLHYKIQSENIPRNCSLKNELIQLQHYHPLPATDLEGMEVLASLGLTGRQARVYLATLKLGGGKVSAIAELSSVSRQEIYRLIDGLQEKGLIRKNITTPITYTAAPIDEAGKLLLQQKTAQLTVISEQIKQLTKKLRHNNHVPSLIGQKPCFGTVFEADNDKKYSHALTKAEHSIEIVTSWTRFKQLNIHYETQLQNALKKHIILHIVTEKPPNHHLPKWIKPALSKYSTFKIRIKPTPPAAAVTIFDQTSVDLAFSPNLSLLKGPDMWAETLPLTTLCQAYFDAIWVQAKNCRSRQISV